MVFGILTLWFQTLRQWWNSYLDVLRVSEDVRLRTLLQASLQMEKEQKDVRKLCCCSCVGWSSTMGSSEPGRSGPNRADSVCWGASVGLLMSCCFFSGVWHQLLLVCGLRKGQTWARHWFLRCGLSHFNEGMWNLSSCHVPVTSRKLLWLMWVQTEERHERAHWRGVDV